MAAPRLPDLRGGSEKQKNHCILFSTFLGDQKTTVGSEDPLFTDDLCAHAHIRNSMTLPDSEVLLVLLILFMIILI